MATEGEIALRLFLAFLFGTIFGLEREKRHKPAGLRTHALVSLGAAFFTIIGVYGFPDPVTGQFYRGADPTRIAAQIVTGVGFIGGGIIFKDRDRVRGLTTAASIWLTAGLGTGIGAGMYLPAIVTAALGLLSLGLHRLFRRWGLEDSEESEN
jgi:putative Mg2+ transporter-C (MgtC) family protein